MIKFLKWVNVFVNWKMPWETCNPSVLPSHILFLHPNLWRWKRFKTCMGLPIPNGLSTACLHRHRRQILPRRKTNSGNRSNLFPRSPWIASHRMRKILVLLTTWMSQRPPKLGRTSFSSVPRFRSHGPWMSASVSASAMLFLRRTKPLEFATKRGIMLFGSSLSFFLSFFSLR